MVHANSELLVCKSCQVVYLEGPGEDSPASCTGEQRHAYMHPLVLLYNCKLPLLYVPMVLIKMNMHNVTDILH